MIDHTTDSPVTAVETTSRWKRVRDWLCSGEKGSSIVEFAVCMPPLMLLTTGIFAFGITIGNYVTLVNAASVGAMQLAISRGQTLDPCNTTVTAVYAAAPNLKQSSFTFSYSLNGNPFSGTSCSSGSTTTGAAGDLVQGKTAQVTITYPCNLTIYKANNFPSCLLTATTAELIQ